MKCSWESLLALLNCAGTARRRELTAQLVESGDVRKLLKAGRCWPLTSADYEMGSRQACMLSLLGVCLIPCWELPLWFQAVELGIPAFFVRGNPELLQMQGISLVGSRRAHPAARVWARSVARELAAQGRLIVSGGARGIDRAAHEGALDVGAPTVVHLGTAIDKPYPRGHDALFQSILRGGGALISEHPPGELTYRADHAKRNRFIAAHGTELLIVEAGSPSGTLSTASWAHRLGRPIWVSPEDTKGERKGLSHLVSIGKARVWCQESSPRGHLFVEKKSTST